MRRFRQSGLLRSLLLAVSAGWAGTVAAGDRMYWLGNTPYGGWDAEVYATPGVADPQWTTVVYARRADPIETASLQPQAGAARKSLTGTPHALDGIASFYWQDQMTASGEVFDKRAMTAAHKTLPMGTRVRVTNLANGRSAVLRINDRGPYIAGRVIDVSEAAADILGMRSSGLAPVRVEIVSR